MSDWFLTTFSFVIFALFIIIIVAIERQELTKAKEQLTRLVKQAGGQEVDVQFHRPMSTRGVWHFVVHYLDVNGQRHTRRVKVVMSGIGFVEGDFYWDKPLLIPEAPRENSSKEQIIHDLDNEIHRLRQELEEARRVGD